MLRKCEQCVKKEKEKGKERDRDQMCGLRIGTKLRVLFIYFSFDF